MKNIKKLLELVILIICLPQLHSQSVTAKAIFEQYLSQALNFAKVYPREKAYLHFDNTSYYVGDTIWFKAYVTLAGQQTPSMISRPLYVELIDQTGHIVEKQIIKIDQGEGHGQFVLPSSTLSGYYEIRAYTRWMLGFKEAQCFSRTFPIYEQSKELKNVRSINTYNLNPAMQQRPQAKKELSLRFFPEGGQLVKNVGTVIGFLAESRTEGNVSISGSVIENSHEVSIFQTKHDGMGSFKYTPSGEKAVATVLYKGKKYYFDLPDALPSGYVLNVSNKPGALAIRIACNSETNFNDTLAVFFSHDGIPIAYRLVYCTADSPQEFIIRTKDLAGGVNQISLISKAGTTLCDRFCFVMPKPSLDIQLSELKQIYNPYALIKCNFQVTDITGKPIKGSLSVAIRNGLQSDYAKYENNLYTDLLLTSDLKGYIHQPGYYFEGASVEKQAELDNLLLIHGWKKYDISQLIGTTPYKPSQNPETKLILYGQVKSTILKNELKDILVSVVAKSDSTIIAGKTVTDSHGQFEIPIEDFENSMEAVFQTQRNEKSGKKMTTIMLDRNFSPALKEYSFNEWHPTWENVKRWKELANINDSVYSDSVQKNKKFHLLNDIIITAKKRNEETNTHIYEKSIDAFYDVCQEVNRMRDEGKEVKTLPEFMENLNPYFYWDRQNDSCTYEQKPICYFCNGHILSPIEVTTMLTEIDGLQSIYICKGANAFNGGLLSNNLNSTISNHLSANNDVSSSSGLSSNSPRDFDHGQKINIMELSKYAIFYLVSLPNRDIVNKQQSAARGTRQTIIQGYNHPLEFYFPVYNDTLPLITEDNRRTLYWNPSVVTDEQGKASITCYNNQYSSPIIIDAEILSNGKVGTITYSTLPY